MSEQPSDDAYRVYVPLREAACGVSLRFFRDQGGARCAVGFTRLEHLGRLLGPDQPYYRLTLRAVRELAAARGVTGLLLDPALVAAPVRELEPLTTQAPTPLEAPAAATALLGGRR